MMFGMKYGKSDLEEYRANYPDNKDDPKANDNLLFYKGEIPAQPEKVTIDEIHEKWFGNHEWLEFCHSYIQWIFPIQEKGLNWDSQILQKHEIEEMNKLPEVKERLVKSYEMMLDFYGMRLVDKETGEIGRVEKFEECYDNLNTSGHNYLRITRILKSLGEFGLEHYKAPWLKHFETEIYNTKMLINCRNSYETYWLGTIRDDETRKNFEEAAEELGKKLPVKKSYWM